MLKADGDINATGRASIGEQEPEAVSSMLYFQRLVTHISMLRTLPDW
jgi:hypothetical protein